MRARHFAGTVLVLSSACTAFAQTTTTPSDRSVVVFGGLAVSSVRLDGAVGSSFTVPFLYTASASTSTAEQLLTIAGNRGTGFEVGLNLFLSRHVGLQVRFERSGGDIGGTNAPYIVHLDYLYTPPAVL